MPAASSIPDDVPLFVFAGGGSGGHLYPGLAIADELRQLIPQGHTRFLCSDREIDRNILTSSGVHWTPLRVPTGRQLLQRPWSRGREFWSAWRQSISLLRGHPRAVVIGTGGFVSGPVVLAAAWLRRPVVLLEPNSVPGRATTSLQRFADLVCTGFPQTSVGLRPSTPVLNSGIALRRELTAGDDLNLIDRPQQILVLGGSQGASELNDLVLRLVQNDPSLFSGWTICHQVGSGDVAATQQVYESAGVSAVVQSFFDPISDAYRSAQVVISRAGATSLAEFACAGLPAVLAPHRQAIRNHQCANAELFVNAGAAVSIAASTTSERLTELKVALQGLLDDQSRRNAFSSAMQKLARPQASAEIAVVIAERIPDMPSQVPVGD